MSPNVARLERQPESAILRCTNDQNPRLTGVELYFQDLEAAKHFYVVFIEVADLAATLGRIDTFLSCCSS